MELTGGVLFFWLLVGHAWADFPLQGAYLAAGKARGSLGPMPWQIALFIHGLIHAGMVAAATGSVVFGLIELVLHGLIDFAKGEKWFGDNQKRAYWIDQGLHVTCKLAYVIILSS